MRAFVTALWENGKQIPRWRWPGLRPLEGEFIFESSEWCELLNRHVRAAILIVPGEGNGDVLKLVDATVQRMKDDEIVISGLEFCPVDGTHAQTWFIELEAFKKQK